MSAVTHNKIWSQFASTTCSPVHSSPLSGDFADKTLSTDHQQRYIAGHWADEYLEHNNRH